MLPELPPPRAARAVQTGLNQTSRPRYALGSFVSPRCTSLSAGEASPGCPWPLCRDGDPSQTRAGCPTPAPECALMWQQALRMHRMGVLAETAAAGAGQDPYTDAALQKGTGRVGAAFCSTRAAQCLLMQILRMPAACISAWEQLFTACGPGRNQQHGSAVNKLIQASPIDFPGNYLMTS